MWTNSSYFLPTEVEILRSRQANTLSKKSTKCFEERVESWVRAARNACTWRGGGGERVYVHLTVYVDVCFLSMRI